MAQRGFLTLASCENPGMTMCSSCGRLMCTMHLSPASGFTQCLECANTDSATTFDENSSTYDSDWSYRYRTSYYAASGYRPISDDYDGTDSAGFHQTAGDSIADDDEVGDPGFGDS